MKLAKAVVPFTLAAFALALAGHAEPIDRIVGDAIRIDVQSSTHAATFVIPKSQLSQVTLTSPWEWSTPVPIAINALDGTSLASFTGRIAYEPTFDNIIADFAIDAGSQPVEVRITSATLIDAFSTTAELLDVSSSLQDMNSDGAIVAPLGSSVRIFKVQWNAATVVEALQGYQAMAGASQSMFDTQQVLGGSFFGSKALLGEFSLSGGDRFTASVAAITSIPVPGAAVILACAGGLAIRRRRSCGG